MTCLVGASLRMMMMMHSLPCLPFLIARLFEKETSEQQQQAEEENSRKPLSQLGPLPSFLLGREVNIHLFSVFLLFCFCFVSGWLKPLGAK